MPGVERRAARHWLLPHERLLGRFAGRVTDPPPGGKRWAFQQNYGPEGDVFLAACTADLIAAGSFLLIGVILLSAGGSAGALAVAGYGLMGVAILTVTLGIFRALQGARAGRVFRAGRPFVHSRRR